MTVTAAIAFTFGVLTGGVVGILLGLILTLIFTAGPDDFEPAPRRRRGSVINELPPSLEPTLSMAPAAPPGTFGV